MKLLLTSFVAVLVLGCATSRMEVGKDFDASKLSSINKGVTTKAEILKTFGEPYTKTVTDSTETWIYTYIKSTGSATVMPFVSSVSSKANTKSLSVSFNGDGVVQTYSYTTSQP